ncbi:MAG: 50S ribosomal protein L20 [Deltaproteobacteria bacterium]|nr:50S ribosomal protein L20 [Deltaproteobacteria bacterium]
MSRAKRGFKARRRRTAVLLACRGYRGARSRLYRVAKEAWMHAGNYAFRDRHQHRRDIRSLWIVRINAAVRQHGVKYSTFMHWLSKANIQLDRRALADMALHDPAGFEALVGRVRTLSGVKS